MFRGFSRIKLSYLPSCKKASENNFRVALIMPFVISKMQHWNGMDEWMEW